MATTQSEIGLCMGVYEPRDQGPATAVDNLVGIGGNLVGVIEHCINTVIGELEAGKLLELPIAG